MHAIDDTPDEIERIFTRVGELLERVCDDGWSHRSLGCLAPKSKKASRGRQSRKVKPPDDHTPGPRRSKPDPEIGQRFGKQLVLAEDGYGKDGHKRYRCRCDCGHERTIGKYVVIKGLGCRECAKQRRRVERCRRCDQPGHRAKTCDRQREAA